MIFFKNLATFIVINIITSGICILPEENSKHLLNPLEKINRKKRPYSGQSSGCNFNGGKPKDFESGRTFFDLAFLNVGYNYQYNINCGGLGGGGGGGGGYQVTESNPEIYKPIIGNKPFLGSHKPHRPNKPFLGGNHNSGEGSQNGGFLANRPFLSGLLGSFSQSQSQTQASTGDSLLGSLLPSPQQFGQGLGNGISSFIYTIPQIGQSFQSLLPNFDNFQLPSLPSLPSFTQGGGAPATPAATSAPPVITSAPFAPLPTDTPTDPIDPDDIIYSDDVKPVSEVKYLVTGNNKLPPGRYLDQQYKYQRYRDYQHQREQANYRNPQQGRSYDGYGFDSRQHYDQTDDIHSNRRRGQGFRFPS